MEDWFKEDPNLLEKEITELKKNGIIVNINIDFDSFARIGVNMDCIIPMQNTLGLDLNEDLGLRIIFPSNYPYFRPEVSITTNVMLPRHQNPSGKNLCLIPRPSQYWNPEDSLFTYLKERLPIVLNKGKIVDQNIIRMDPDEQAEPVSEYYISKTNIAVFSARPNYKQKEIPLNNGDFSILDHGSINIKCDLHNDTVKLYEILELGEGKFNFFPKLNDNSDVLKIELSEWFDSDGNSIVKFPHRKFLQSGTINKIKWYQINSLSSLLNNKDSYQMLLSEIKKAGLKIPNSCNIHTNDFVINSIVGIVFPEETIAGEIEWGWGLVINGIITKKNGKNLNPKLPHFLVLPIMSVDHEDLSARIPQSASLSGKTISVIGLGSLGAPSILEFAKNGVTKLKLMDFDIVDTTTSVRWPLGIESAGSLKTSALKKFINANYPYVEIETFNHKIGSVDFLTYPNENKIINDFLNETSLVYDASAEEGVSNLLSVLCKQRNIPYIAIEGRRGAWGGIVMRVLPETKKGCWMCLQHSLYDKTIALPKEDTNGNIQPKGCGDLTFTGSSFDLQNISLAGVRMAVMSLSNTPEESNWDVAVLSMVDDKAHPIAPKWETKSLEINPNCPVCKLL